MTGYRDYEHSPLQQLIRFVTQSFSIGTFFGVHVRMYWAAAILTPLLASRWMPGEGLFALTMAVVVSALLFVVIWTHEMCHIAAGWRFRIRTDLITLSPFGGLAHMNSGATTPRAELLISLAGPAVHVAWLAVFWPLYWLLPAAADGAVAQGALIAVSYLVWINGALAIFNLIPFFPLDGGRCLRALLAMRVHANRATMWTTSIGIGGGVLFVILALTEGELSSFVLLMIGVFCISSSLNERRMARHALVYQHTIRDPWEVDPEAWKYGGDPRAPTRRSASWFARWRAARAERKAADRAAERQQLDREVDRILERVHEVGMSGLSEREKAILKRAAQRRRGAG